MVSREMVVSEAKRVFKRGDKLEIKQVPIKITEPKGGEAKINWNLNVRDGKIVYMPPEEYMERVNIFNRIGMSRVLEQEQKAIGKGYRGIGYYPPLSESSYRTILAGIRAGNEIDIPNIVYRNGMVDDQEGFHRSLVARDLGIDRIPVHIFGDMPSVFSRALNLNWNQNLTEQVKAINALKGKVIGGVFMIREGTTPAPEPGNKEKEFRANPNLISRDLAMRSHSGTSFDPEKRGEQEIAAFVAYVQEVYEHLKKYAKTDRQKEYLLTEMERFQSSFVSKYNAKLSAQGGCLSTMIAGPSNFPVRRAEKACSAADKRYEELIEFRDRAESAILRELKKMAVEEAGGEIEVLKKKIADAERNHEFMVKTNVIVRKKIPDDQKVREIMALGPISEKTAREILKPDFMQRVGFPAYALSNDTANIHRMKERLKELEKKEVTPTGEIPFTGGYIVDNREADRVQIIFDQRPSQEIINKLKSEGWRWSPANVAWQRKRTDAAMYSARRITGAAPAVQPQVAPPIPAPQPQAVPETGNLDNVITLMEQYAREGKTYDDFVAGLKGYYLSQSGFQINNHLDTEKLKAALGNAGYYTLSELWNDESKKLRMREYVPPKYAPMLYPAAPQRPAEEIMFVPNPETMTKEEFVKEKYKRAAQVLRQQGKDAIAGRIEKGARDPELTYKYETSHRDQVVLALAQGKTVAPEVLKDYPDIVARVRKENEEIIAKERAERERLLAIERAEENELTAELNRLPPPLKRHAETEIYGTLHMPETHKDYRNRYYIALGIVRRIAYAHLPGEPQPPVQPQIPVPTVPVAKPVQSIQDIKQQVINSMHEAKSMDELRQILRGLGFLPLPDSEKRQLIDLYQVRTSELMGELKFGERITEEEKKKKRRAPQRTPYVPPSRRLEEFGVKEAMRRGYGYA